MVKAMTFKEGRHTGWNEVWNEAPDKKRSLIVFDIRSGETHKMAVTDGILAPSIRVGIY